jgi:ATP-dependent exoDNAse (exonuclease V) beta subunit
VVDRLRSRKHGAQGALWSRPLVGEEVSEADAEELHIAFVALTRARRYCLVALPDDSNAGVIDAFEQVGFRRR